MALSAEALQGQKQAGQDDLTKSFASLMLVYAAGDEIDMKETLANFPLRLKSVREHANEVMGR